ncbi:MAG: hypothetical protein GY827_04455 [Cytophagales bacterium]|nr:hypothetical protein [Cytophagales bacterium]
MAIHGKLKGHGLPNDVEVIMSEDSIDYIYLTEDIESIPRDELRALVKGREDYKLTLYTNAGVDLHSSEDSIDGMVIKRLAPAFYSQLLNDLGV